MAASEVEICNSALDLIGAEPIIALDSTSKTSRILTRNYGIVRDAVIRAHPWNCAIHRMTIAADATAPDSVYTYQYTLPSDPYCLRMLDLPDEDPDTEWKVEGRKLLTDVSAPLAIRFLKRITDPLEYDPLMAEAIATRLAAKIAYSVTGSRAMMIDLFNAYQSILGDARTQDSFEGTTSIEFADPLIEARF